jgi:nitroreductase
VSVFKKIKRVAKQALAIPAVRKTYETATRAVLDVGGSSRLGATIYSLPGFLTFNREQYAVLAGRRAYYKNFTKPRRSHVELRRNVHRLEKGLIMEPRRPVFARDYILETVEFYLEAVKGTDQISGIDPAELTWAHNVLEAYFEAVDHSDPVIARALEGYRSVSAPVDVVIDRHLSPYEHSEVSESDVSYDQLLALARRRRSVRWFEPRPVPRELLDRAMIVAREAPTACNREPFEFRFFDDPETVQKVANIAQGAGGYAHQIPTLAVVIGRLDSYFSPRDRHVPYIDASLAGMQFMLALETEGLSSSIINWPDFELLEAKMQRTLGLAPFERVVYLMAIGYPRSDGFIPSSVKKSVDVLRTYDAPTK